jgi:general secretion pathway protein L
VFVVLGADVMARRLAIPAGTEAQQGAAAAHLVEDFLASPREGVHVAAGPREADGHALVLTVARDRMAAWCAQIEALGLEGARITPDFLLLPQPQGENLNTVATDGMIAARGFDYAFTVEEDLFPRLAGTRESRFFDPDEVLRGFVARGGASGIDLRQGAFAPRTSLLALVSKQRRLAVLAALLLVSPLLLWMVESARHGIAAYALEAEAHDIAANALSPRVAEDPVTELRAGAAALRGSEAFLTATAELARGISATSGAELVSLSYLRDGVLQAVVRHETEDDLAGVRAHLEAQQMVTEQGATDMVAARSETILTLRPIP